VKEWDPNTDLVNFVGEFSEDVIIDKVITIQINGKPIMFYRGNK
jgi:hypothetical protein